MTDDDRPTYNGRYEVQRRVARGGMADVFLAKDLLLARPVAVKVLFPEFASDPSFVARFRREAQAAANLNHPNIVGVYDWGQEGGTYYIVMEFIDGRSLSEILRTQGTPPAKTAAGIAADVAAALGFAHRNGVVHRDIKPGNIMITNGGHVKVADFGIARAMHASAEDNLTQTGSVMGTATYFSPEQAQGHNVDQRSDLYSLGIVMYEMAHGKPPFVADSPIAVAYKHVQEAPPSLREAHPEVPEGYEAITMRLLAKSPDDRYPDAEALRADLRRFTEGQKVRAPAVATGAAGVAAAGAAGAAVGAAAGAAAATGPATGGTVVGAAPVAPPVDAGTSASRAVPAAGPPTGPEYGHEQARRSRTGWFILLLVLLLGVLGGLLWLFASTLGIGDETTVEVPDVTGQPFGEARDTLTEAGFAVDPVPQRQASDTVPVDSVISQDPPGGQQAEEGSTVRLVVSSGPAAAATVPMPDVVGLSYDEALARLTEAGFTNVSPRERDDPDVPEDEVISQNPSKDSPTALDFPVTLVISTGEAPTTTTEEPPVTDPPVTDPPETEPPETEPPVTEPPVTEPPVTDPPVTDPPVTDSTSSSSSSSVPAAP
jgi:serine/threonine-protein kinase